MLNVDILSLFPAYFESPLKESILKKAQEKKILSVQQHDIRSFAEDKRSVDDRPFGGGPGMLLKPQPVRDAINSVKREDSYVVFLSPQGKKLSPNVCKELAGKQHLILLCGHYEGIDQRIVDEDVDCEISIGDYVLTNGCLSSIVLLDAVARFIPGVLGNEQTANNDSFESGLLDCPHYTRPANYQGQSVPEVLLNGNHEEVAKWRRQKALEKTRLKRPDLYLSFLAQETSQQQEPTSDLRAIEKRLNAQAKAFVCVAVKDMKRALSFYRRVLGFCLESKQSDLANLCGAGLNLRLVESEQKQEQAFTLQVKPSFFAEISKKVMTLGAKVIDEKTVLIKDPDGNSWMLISL